MSGKRQPEPTVVIGLLGGVAAGKSTVAAMFGEAGLQVLDADQKAHAVVRIPAVKDQLVQRFGPEVYAADGELRRQHLADLVFGDEGARQDLEAITHPAIRAELEAELDQARARGMSVVLDVPLLLEGGLIDRCDHAVFIAAGEETRLARARTRGWDAEELRRRQASQAPLAQKQARCEFTVDNDRERGDSRRQVEQILRRLGLGGRLPGESDAKT